MYEQVLRKVRVAGEKKGIWTELRYRLPLLSVSPEAKARIEANTQLDTRHWITTVLADVTFGIKQALCCKLQAGELESSSDVY